MKMSGRIVTLTMKISRGTSRRVFSFFADRKEIGTRTLSPFCCSTMVLKICLSARRALFRTWNRWLHGSYLSFLNRSKLPRDVYGVFGNVVLRFSQEIVKIDSNLIYYQKKDFVEVLTFDFQPEFLSSILTGFKKAKYQFKGFTLGSDRIHSS